MRIAIDARNIFSSTGRYTERLLAHLQDLDSENEYIVILLPQDAPRWKPHTNNFRVVTSSAPIYTFREQINLALLLYRLRPDLVHFTMPQQPLLWFGRRVTTIHDLSLVNFVNRRKTDPLRSFYKFTIKPWVFKTILGQFARRSRYVITPTNYVRQQVASQLGVPEGRVVATHEAVDPLTARPEAIPGLKDKHFMFFVGNAYPYKNLRRLIDAVAQIPDTTLVLAGKKEFFYEELERYVHERGISNVQIIGFVTDAQMAWLHQHAALYVIASLSEGFSLTGLEAMYYGLPVASSNATCLPEVYGQAAEYFDPLDTDNMRDTIHNLLNNPGRLKELKAAGLRRVKDFSWRRMAEQTLEVYAKALKTKR